ncbi:MAG TPA: urea ABC transporter ATP-binding subunit UrtE [Roseiflexaceae bacterium]|nr:urea ABC transporter ATP-binding subunit UrtE [Roseiflexaceae bacterium]
MLNVEQLSVSYGESSMLREVSLNVPAGQVVCLMGRNGVGKTTLLKAIIGLLRARAGRIVFQGRDLTAEPPHRRARAGIGYVPQGRGIFPYLTVYENLLIGFEATPGQKVERAAIEEMYELFPVLAQMRSRAAGTLSGGQQQQLAIARALVRRPTLLLLDEPTEGVQPSVMHEIEAVIRSLQQRGDMAILLVEQFLDFALSVASYCYVMETGAIVAQGPATTFDQVAAREYLAF